MQPNPRYTCPAKSKSLYKASLAIQDMAQQEAEKWSFLRCEPIWLAKL
jgi:hypothetical protein